MGSKTVPMAYIPPEIGLGIFIFSLLIAIGLYIIDQYKRINLTLPYGKTIPYTLAVIGGGIFFLAIEGIYGLFAGIATAIFVGFVMQHVSELQNVD